MKVPYLSLKRQFSELNISSLFERVFSDCNFINGAQVEIFERNFAELCGVPYAVAVNSGTDALLFALKASGVGPGDEVITAPNSFIASAGAIALAGAKPVFVDVQADYNLDVEKIEDAITPKTRAVLPVHLTGNPCDMGPIVDLCNRFGLELIEDAAQAVGASYRGQKVGSFGIGCFSLHPLKNLNACGDGGVLTTKSKEIYERVRGIRNHGLINRDESVEFGYCSRLDTLQAVVVLEGLKRLPGLTLARQANARYYDELLASAFPNVILPPRKEGFDQVFHTYVVRVRNRSELIKFLEKNGVETKIHYPIPLHLQKAAASLGYKKGDFPVCESQSSEILTLPIHQYLSREDQEYVVSTIQRFYQST